MVVFFSELNLRCRQKKKKKLVQVRTEEEKFCFLIYFRNSDAQCTPINNFLLFFFFDSFKRGRAFAILFPVDRSSHPNYEAEEQVLENPSRPKLCCIEVKTKSKK